MISAINHRHLPSTYQAFRNSVCRLCRVEHTRSTAPFTSGSPFPEQQHMGPVIVPVQGIPSQDRWPISGPLKAHLEAISKKSKFFKNLSKRFWQISIRISDLAFNVCDFYPNAGYGIHTDFPESNFQRKIPSLWSPLPLGYFRPLAIHSPSLNGGVSSLTSTISGVCMKYRPEGIRNTGKMSEKNTIFNGW